MRKQYSALLLAGFAGALAWACGGTGSPAPGQQGGSVSVGGGSPSDTGGLGESTTAGPSTGVGSSEPATGGVSPTGSSEVGGAAPTGGRPGTGGALTGTGGKAATGGAPTSGQPGTGGAVTGTGGKAATGGSRASGGRSSTGGRASGGRSSTGGAVADGGSNTAGTGGTCVPNTSCTPTAPNTGDIYADCVARINQFRACVCLPPVTRNTAAEACLDQDAQNDQTKEIAHDGFSNNICTPQGNAQNECPGWLGWKSTTRAIDQCIQGMFDEGPPPTTPCSGTCYQTYGHYINMTGNFKQAACGFYTAANGEVTAVQNFYK